MMRAEHIRDERKGRIILDDISLSLREGELTALVGPNGAGKSTLVTLLAGIRKPGAGRVLLADRPLLSYPPRERARRIAYLAQQQDFAWDLEVSDIIALGAAARTAVAPVLARLGLAHLAHRRIKTLSGGERARVMLARAVAAEPRILLADEPAAHLDVKQERSAMRTLRAEVRARRMAALVVMHDLNLACRFSDRLLVLSDGRLTLDAPTAEAVSSPEIDRAFGLAFSRIEVEGTTVLLPIEADT